MKVVHLKPVCVVRDPFRGKPHVLVLCESYLEDRTTPASQNYRYTCYNLSLDGYPSR